MARHRVADRGDGIQIWKVAANIPNKTADKGWTSRLGVGQEGLQVIVKIQLVTECYKWPRTCSMELVFRLAYESS